MPANIIKAQLELKGVHVPSFILIDPLGDHCLNGSPVKVVKVYGMIWDWLAIGKVCFKENRLKDRCF